jgi:hypothetical protein
MFFKCSLVIGLIKAKTDIKVKARLANQKVFRLRKFLLLFLPKKTRFTAGLD